MTSRRNFEGAQPGNLLTRSAATVMVAVPDLSGAVRIRKRRFWRGALQRQARIRGQEHVVVRSDRELKRGLPGVGSGVRRIPGPRRHPPVPEIGGWGRGGGGVEGDTRHGTASRSHPMGNGWRRLEVAGECIGWRVKSWGNRRERNLFVRCHTDAHCVNDELSGGG